MNKNSELTIGQVVTVVYNGDRKDESFVVNRVSSVAGYLILTLEGMVSGKIYNFDSSKTGWAFHSGELYIDDGRITQSVEPKFKTTETGRIENKVTFITTSKAQDYDFSGLQTPCGIHLNGNVFTPLGIVQIRSIGALKTTSVEMIYINHGTQYKKTLYEKFSYEDLQWQVDQFVESRQ